MKSNFQRGAQYENACGILWNSEMEFIRPAGGHRSKFHVRIRRWDCVTNSYVSWLQVLSHKTFVKKLERQPASRSENRLTGGSAKLRRVKFKHEARIHEVTSPKFKRMKFEHMNKRVNHTVWSFIRRKNVKNAKISEHSAIGAMANHRKWAGKHCNMPP